MIVLVKVFFFILMSELDFLHVVELLLKAFDFLDPSSWCIFIPLFEKAILTVRIELTNLLVQLFQKLFLDSFRGFLFLELLLSTNLSLQYFIKLSLVIYLPELSKSNQFTITVIDFNFAFRTCQGFDSWKRVFHSDSNVCFMICFPPSLKAWFTCKMTFLLLASIHLNVIWKVIFTVVAYAAFRSFAIPEFLIDSRKSRAYFASITFLRWT